MGVLHTLFAVHLKKTSLIRKFGRKPLVGKREQQPYEPNLSPTQMSFGSGLMKVLSVSSSQFMHQGMGQGLANIHIFLLLHHTNHIKEASSPGELGHIFIAKAEKGFSSLFLTPKILGQSPAVGLSSLEMEPVLFGTYHGCQFCLSGHSEASDVPHHPCKDVALYFNEYTE